MLIVPFIFLLQGQRSMGGFGVAFSGTYVGLVPMFGLGILRYSQQWQASDVFRVAPMPGPAPLCNGARLAVQCILTLPMLVLFALVVWLIHRNISDLCLLLPGIVALPVYALVPAVVGQAVPLSVPTEEAKSAGRGMSMMGVMLISMGVAALSYFSWTSGWFWEFLAGEIVIAATVYFVMRSILNSMRWKSAE